MAANDFLTGFANQQMSPSGAIGGALDDIAQRRQNKLLLQMKSSLIEQEMQAKQAERENELAMQLKYAPQLQAAKLAMMPKIGDSEVTALKAMLGPRASKDQIANIEKLRGQPIANLDALSNAAKNFKLGNAGAMAPWIDGSTGVPKGWLYQDENGMPKQLESSGSGPKIAAAGAIQQYLASLKRSVVLHDLLTESKTGSGPTLQALLQGKLGGSFANLQAQHGYNDIAAELSAEVNNTAGLASQVNEHVPGSRLSQNVLKLTEGGRFTPEVKNSVVHKVYDDMSSLANETLSDLRKPDVIGNPQTANSQPQPKGQGNNPFDSYSLSDLAAELGRQHGNHAKVKAAQVKAQNGQ